MKQAEPSRADEPEREQAGPRRPAPEGSRAMRDGPAAAMVRDPGAQRLLTRLGGVLDQVARESPTARVADVGCGAGAVTECLRRRWDDVTAVDLPGAGLRDGRTGRTGPRHVHGDVTDLPFADATFDVVASVGVLERVRDPAAGLRELARVARRHLVLAVPREPAFRLATVARARRPGAPGRLNHWSSPDFIRFVSAVGAVADVAKPLPWMLVWVRLD